MRVSTNSPRRCAGSRTQTHPTRRGQVTPEAAVFDAKGRLIYRGRIDDLYADFGKKRARPTRHDLRDTLDALLAGKRLTKRTTKAVGCYIDFSNDKKKNE
ncbi:MAG: hypothetical protein Ct9H300mP32_2720 [Verrucomicrobiota bacterium]|nr:MAG: hypothetical protein Ct9H300mP32_2720 [Verrucomicrobiota bacterium]